MTNSTVLAVSFADRWHGFWTGTIGEWILVRGVPIALYLIGGLLAEDWETTAMWVKDDIPSGDPALPYRSPQMLNLNDLAPSRPAPRRTPRVPAPPARPPPSDA